MLDIYSIGKRERERAPLFVGCGVYQVAFSSKSKSSSSLNDYDDEVVGGRIPSPLSQLSCFWRPSSEGRLMR